MGNLWFGFYIVVYGPIQTINFPYVPTRNVQNEINCTGKQRSGRPKVLMVLISFERSVDFLESRCKH